MRIIVISDTHRDFASLRKLVELHHAATDIFIHLGDGAQELLQIQQLYPETKWLSARGNCDFGVETALAGCFNANGTKIFYTHGHMYNVKYDLDALLAAAKDIEADIVLFGHTHVPMCTYQDGRYLMNPGSLGLPRGPKGSYGVVDLSPQGIVCFLNEL